MTVVQTEISSQNYVTKFLFGSRRFSTMKYGPYDTDWIKLPFIVNQLYFRGQQQLIDI